MAPWPSRSEPGPAKLISGGLSPRLNSSVPHATRPPKPVTSKPWNRCTHPFCEDLEAATGCTQAYVRLTHPLRRPSGNAKSQTQRNETCGQAIADAFRATWRQVMAMESGARPLAQARRQLRRNAFYENNSECKNLRSAWKNELNNSSVAKCAMPTQHATDGPSKRGASAQAAGDVDTMHGKTDSKTRSLWISSTGTTATEYATLLALIVVVILVSSMLLGKNVSGNVSTASSALDDGGGGFTDDAGGGGAGDGGRQSHGEGRGRGKGRGHGRGGG
jgi:Flp pilus assembly pilin Flp